MATYYKYAERQADSFVNWAEIGKNMTDMLANENKIREEKKAAIDKASREFGEVLSEGVQGEHKGVNQWSLEYANEAQQARLLQDKLLKSGQLKLKDYLVQRQNITDGTTQAFSLMKEYQEEYKNKMERMKNDSSQDLEGWLMSEAEGFSNFSQSQLYINPTDYSVAVGKMVKNEKTGVMELSKNPNDYSTVSSLRNRIKGTFDKFDVPSTLSSFVDSLGAELNAIKKVGGETRTGSISETLDITKRTSFGSANKGIVDNFEKAETKALQSYLTNPYNVSSVLTNSIKAAPNGEQYTFTWNPDEAKANKNLILLKNDPKSGNPTPQFTAEQEKAALEHLRVQARLMYDKKESIQAVTEPKRAYAPEYVGKKADEDELKLNAAGYWNQLYTGKTAADKTAAAEVLLGTPQAKADGLVDIDMRKNGVIELIYADQTKNRPISYLDKNGKPISLQDFSAKGVEIHGVTDRKKAMQAGGGGKGFGAVADLSNVRASRQGEPPKPIGMPLSGITQESGKASTVLRSAVPRGFTVEDLGGPFGNDIKITAPNNKTFKYKAKAGADAANIIKKDLDQFIQNNMVAETEAPTPTNPNLPPTTIQGGTPR
jgi:hypothetical protein